MTEYKELAEVVKWFREQWPEHSAALRPSMNGLSWRGEKGARMWNQMIAIGADKGDPDMAILIPKGKYFGFVCEHKAMGKDREVTDEQDAQLDYFRGLGYYSTSTRGTDALKAAITVYMEL